MFLKANMPLDNLMIIRKVCLSIETEAYLAKAALRVPEGGCVKMLLFFCVFLPVGDVQNQKYFQRPFWIVER